MNRKRIYTITKAGRFVAECEGRDGLAPFDWYERIHRGQEPENPRAPLWALIADIEAMGYIVTVGTWAEINAPDPD